MFLIRNNHRKETVVRYSLTMKMVQIVLMVMMLSLSVARALTLESGQVIGGDGNIYDGASPEQKEVYIKRAKEGGDQAGISGRNVYVVVEDDIAFVPLNELAGKSKSGKISRIGDAVVAKISGSDALSYEQLTQMQKVAEETGVPLADILVLEDALQEMDEELASLISQEIDKLVQEGALEQVQAFLESVVIVENLSTIAEVTRQVEAELGELATEIDYYNACLEKAGASTCDDIMNEMSEIGG